MKNRTVIIIPARYGSSRYRGKPLVKILGRELVLRVADVCKRTIGISNLYVATDSKKISNLVEKSNYKAVFTSRNCMTGTDRVAQASKKIDAKIFINVQGDEPLVNPKDIKAIITAKKKFPKHVICGYDKIHKLQEPKSLNLPKVVVNSKKELIYISRSLIPGSKKTIQNKNYFKQVCIYAFNKSELKKFYSLKKKSEIEEMEDIEILRFFDLGIKIKMIKLNSNSVAVDEIADVKKAEKIIKQKKQKKN
ncbi:3-deoxy-manno-octulosonate cytidylyltransferase [Pelagibacteraceae bacterium]|nr:3-deoxy-manno-octulosonate cytidylyltransferase [Pelagibacteraceae bacterium]